MRRQPVRTCVGCRSRDVREVLTRLVARDGAVLVDATRAAAGRGAWVHARDTCLEAFARRGGFVRSLRCVIPKPERVALRMQLSEVQG